MISSTKILNNILLLFLLHYSTLTRANTASDAASAVSTVCSGLPNWQSYINPQAQSVVSTFVGTNIMTTLINNCTMSTIVSCATGAYQTQVITGAVKAAIGIILAIITLVLWLLVFPCFCCRCCRRCCCLKLCCIKESDQAKNFSSFRKIFSTLWFIAFLGGIIACVVFAANYRAGFSGGNKAMICEVFSFANDTLNGFTPSTTDKVPLFIGVNPALTQINSLVGQLNPNSSFISQVGAIVQNTAPISQAMATLSAQLDVMNRMLGLPANNQVGNYQCMFCNACCSGPNSNVANVQKVISGGTATALQGVRAMVNSQLQGPALNSTYTNVLSATNPLNSLVSFVDTSIGTTLISNQSLISTMLSYIDLVVLIITALVAVPIFFGLITISCGIWNYNRDYGYGPDTRKPQTPCHASCSWCCGCLYSFLIFLICGIILLITFLLANICGVLTDINNQLPALLAFTSGNATQTNATQMMITMVQTCLNTSGTGDLLGTLGVAGSLNISAMIQSQFDALQGTLGGSLAGNSLANDASFVALMAAITQFGSLYIIPPATQLTIQTQPSYKPQLLMPDHVTLGPDSSLSASTLSNLYLLGLGGTPSCANVSLNLTGAPSTLYSAFVTMGNTIVNNVTSVGGVNQYMTACANQGITFGSGVNTCANLATTAASGSRLVPWGNMLNDYATVMNKANFVCNTTSLALDAKGNWIATDVAGTCNWVQWQAYVANWPTILTNAALAVDSSVGTTLTAINTNLRSLVTSSVVSPMTGIVQGMNCGFMGRRYNLLVSAFCSASVPSAIGLGIVWLALGFIFWFVVVLEMSIWRRLKDNKCIWMDNQKKGGANNGNGNNSNVQMLSSLQAAANASGAAGGQSIIIINTGKK